MFGEPGSEERRYWLTLVGTWTTVALAHIGLVTLLGGFEASAVFLYGLLGALALLASHLLRQASRRWRWHELSLLRLVLAFTSSIVAGCAVVAAFVGATSLLGPLLRSTPFGWEEIPFIRDAGSVAGQAIYWSFMLLAWLLFHLGHQLMQRLRNTDLRRLRLEAAVTEAELRALKAQLDPHFIFNSLNGIRALVEEDPPRAREMITRLAGILRFTLRAGDRDTVLLREELETVRNYLALEGVRFEGRLECDFDVAADTLDIPVPPMVVQHLVENGIKHGVGDRPGRGRLRVVSWCDRGGERLLIEVHNQGRLRAVSGDGVGLEKSRERLQLIYGDAAQLVLESDSGDVCARMTVPVLAT